jgi:L-rhamnose mutarotase
MKRIANITKLKEGAAVDYKALHDNIWEEIVAAGHQYGLRNFTMFRHGEYLFSYYEYVGDDFERDMAEKAKCPNQDKWQAECGKHKTQIDGKNAIMLEEFWHHDF